MARKKRKVYKRVQPEVYDPFKELKKSLKAVKWNLVIQLFIAFVLVFGIYRAAIALEFGYIMPIYYGIFIILIILYIFLNGGIKREGPDTKKRRAARKLLILIIPFLINYAIEVLLIFYFDK